MRGFMRRSTKNGLNATLEALIKMVDRSLVYITQKKQPIFRPTVFQGVINMNKPNKELNAKLFEQHYDQF